MNILIAAAPKYNAFSLMIVGAVIAGIILLAYLKVLFVKHVVHGKTYVAARAKADTICGWEYSAAEWQKYATEFGLSENPQGAATVRITPLDLWFADDADTLRKPIGSSIMMVTDYRYSNNVLKIRIRSHSNPGKNDYYRYCDYLIPVPADKTREAIKATEFFENNIVRNLKKFDWVTPSGIHIGLFGEPDF